MKKLVGLFFTCVMLVSMCACGSKSAYEISVVDESGAAIEGVRVQMCDDSTCTTEETDSKGVVVCDNDASSLEVHILGAPEGYVVDTEEVYVVDSNNKKLTVTLSPEK